MDKKRKGNERKGWNGGKDNDKQPGESNAMEWRSHWPGAKKEKKTGTETVTEMVSSLNTFWAEFGGTHDTKYIKENNVFCLP